MGFLLKSRNERMLKGYKKMALEVKHLREELQNSNEEELKHKADNLKHRLQSGAQFKEIVSMGLALACAAAHHTLNMEPYEVQIVGALALLDGKIGEMRTGEGKTLTAALAAFVRSLEGKGVHIVTVNDYLARRDGAALAPLFAFLGQSVGVVYPGMPDELKAAAYACDITYATNNEVGFDYLRDNMAVDLREQRQRGLYYAIIDEVDSILIDEARTPLIISGPHLEGPDVYAKIDHVAQHLVRTDDEQGVGDYWADGKNRQVVLTETGMEHAELLLKDAGLLETDDSLYAVHNISLVYHLNAALRAHSLYHKNVAYLVRDGEVHIVDEFTGRAMPGRRWGEGLHQAIEVKEGVDVQPEQQTVASITLQNLFRSYTHLAGMTGTADTEASEFMEIYGLEVVVIPTHKPMIRKDAADMVFLGMNGKLRRVVSDIKEIHATEQPILVGTTSIEMSEKISEMLTIEGIRHKVLNAKQHDKEAAIVADAGVLGAVTIATNMAGRGTDIVLGGSTDHIMHLRGQIKSANPEQHGDIQQQLTTAQHAWSDQHNKVVQLGGLHIIGTERHESRRIDNQLRGRAGRQGDPGSSQFYISFEDTLMKLFASDFAQRALSGLGMKEDDVIVMPLISKQIERAQHNVEVHNFNMRKSLLDYDNVANEQRRVFYTWRAEILSTTEIQQHTMDVLEDAVSAVVESSWMKHTSDTEQGWNEIVRELVQLGIPGGIGERIMRARPPHLSEATAVVMEHLQQWFRGSYDRWPEQWGNNARAILLTAHDLHWREHLSALDTLRKGIHLRGFAQKQPKQEYKREAFDLFRSMVAAARRDSARGVLNMTEHMGRSDTPLNIQEVDPDSVPQNLNYMQDKNWLRPSDSTLSWNTQLSQALFEGGIRQTLPSLQHKWIWRTTNMSA